MPNGIKKLSSLLVLFVSFLSNNCTDTIILGLGENAVKLVIDAKAENLITVDKRASKGTTLDTATQISVVLSRSKDFYNTSETPGVSGATIQVSDPNGVTHVVSETETEGVYTNNTSGYLPPGVYTLSVTSEGKTYTATSTLQPPRQYKDINFKREIANFRGVGDESTLAITALIEGVPDQKNFYYSYFLNYFEESVSPDGFGKFRETGFGTGTALRLGEIYLDDLGRNGQTIPFIGLIARLGNSPGQTRFNQGEIIDLYLTVYDEGAYTYLTDIEKVRDGGLIDISAPFNPRSNIDGDALGYFTAHNIILEKTVTDFEQ